MIETMETLTDNDIEVARQAMANLVRNVLIDYWVQEYRRTVKNHENLPEETDSSTVSEYLKDIACAKQAVKNCLDRLYYINDC